MWTLEESLRGGLMILVGLILIIIIKKIGLLLRKDDIDLTDINDQHSWSELDILLKTYSCSVCGTCLTGNSGKQCDNCGICCHDVCIQSASKTRSCKDIFLLEKTHKMKHHWVRDGNLIPDFCESDDNLCCVCDEECIEAESSISQCCWCQRMRHSQCEFATDDCDFGKYHNFIIPPFCVTPTKPSKLNKKFKVKCLSRPDWERWSPVIVLANRRAGNSDGAFILSYFRRILNPCQVFDLAVHSPSLVVKWCSMIPPKVTLYILIAGGDGTVAWVLNTFNKHGSKGASIPIAIIPLGTGNDLSRVLGWGKEYSRRNNPTSYLEMISRSDIINLDRWCVEIKSASNISIPRVADSYCYNYFSIGVDARVALDFHQTRQTSPLYLSSRMYNKLLYTIFGTRQAVVPDCSGLQNRLELFLDGVKMSLPEVESIVIINIPSWAAGVRLWNHNADPTHMLPQKIDDGKLEVVGIYSSFHIAQLQIGLSEPYYIGQASEVKILLHDTLPVQSDGEPWIQKPAKITITLCNQVKVLKVQ